MGPKFCHYFVLSVMGLFCLMGCGQKRPHPTQNPNVEIINRLNNNNYDFVIQTLQNKSDITLTQRFYLASAYAGKGGIDIYSLFPLLELELFHERILDWSSLERSKNKYAKILKQRSSDKANDSQEARRKSWDSNPELVESKFPVTDVDCLNYPSFVKLCESVYLGWHQLIENNAPNIYVLRIIINNRDYDERIAVYLEQEAPPKDWERFLYKRGHSAAEVEEFMRMKTSLQHHVEAYIDREAARHHYIRDATSTNDSNEEDLPLWIMNMLWTSYESLALLQDLPKLTDLGYEQIFLAIDQLKVLRNDPASFRKASDHMYLLGIVTLLSMYSQALPVESIITPEELFCQFQPAKILDRYQQIRSLTLSLIERPDPEIFSKDELKFIQKHRDEMILSSASMNTQYKRSVLSLVQNSQLKRCSIELMLPHE